MLKKILLSLFFLFNYSYCSSEDNLNQIKTEILNEINSNFTCNGETYIEYHKTGAIKGKVCLIEGLQEGWAYTYFDNARLKRKLFFKNGNRIKFKSLDYLYYKNEVYVLFGDGEEFPMLGFLNNKFYTGIMSLGKPNDNGELSSFNDEKWLQFYFSNGVAKGSFYDYSFGNSRGKYVNGFKDGVWESGPFTDGSFGKQYYKNGQLELEETYIWEQLIRKKLYHNGQLVNTQNF